MKKQWTALAAAAAITLTLLPLGGCRQGGGETGGDSPKDGEPVVVRISMDNKLMTEAAQQFEKDNPDIKIQFESPSDDEQKLMSGLAAGTAPDILRILGAQQLSGYVVKGIALNLDDYFSKSSLIRADNMEDICNTYRFDGKNIGKGSFYGLPKDWSNDLAMFVNKSVFEKAGIPVPSTTEPMTFEQAFELSGKLNQKDSSGRITQLGLFNALMPNQILDYGMFLYHLAALDLSLWSDDFSHSRWTDPQVKAAVKVWMDAKMKMQIPSSLMDVTGVGIFSDKKIAMELWGFWEGSVFKQDANIKDDLDDVIMVPSLYPEGGKKATASTFATGGIIYSKTKHPDEAFRVFEWYFAGEPAKIRAQSGWGMPVFKSLKQYIPRDTAFEKQIAEVAEKDLENLIYIQPNPYLSFNYESVITRFLQPALYEIETLDESLEKLQKETDILIQEGMETAKSLK